MSDVFGTIGNGLSMIGNVETTAADTATIEAGMSAALASLPAKEAASEKFMAEYGAEVLGGHGMVDKPIGEVDSNYGDT